MVRKIELCVFLPMIPIIHALYTPFCLGYKQSIRNPSLYLTPEMNSLKQTLETDAVVEDPRGDPQGVADLPRRSKRFSKKTAMAMATAAAPPSESPAPAPASAPDIYTKEILETQYALHKAYVMGRIETTKKIGVKVRLPSIPEDISENIIKQIIRNKLHDSTSSWDCKGDLQSKKEGKQECKCFTSDGPLSFTPSSEWDIIYFLDARNWLQDQFILYRSALKRTSVEWQNLRMSKTQTFEDQTNQGRRPRIGWESLFPQIQPHCTKVYEGTFENLLIPEIEATE